MGFEGPPQIKKVEKPAEPEIIPVPEPVAPEIPNPENPDGFQGVETEEVKPEEFVVENKEEQPRNFIKEFSKDTSPEERNEVAQEIKTKRAEYFSPKKERENKIEVLEGKITEKTSETQKQLERIENLSSTLENLNSSVLTRISKYFEIKKLKADLERGTRTYEQLLQERGTAISEKEFLEALLHQGDTSEKLQKAKNMLQEFYEEQKHKWVESDYTKEDIAKYFTEEHLSSLSLEDYILLLKRFPKNMVTHVTRQGIRDHFAMSEHSTGLGGFSDGFTQILKEGRLKSALGIYVAEGLKEKSIRDFIINAIEEPLIKEGKEEGKEYAHRRALQWLEDFTAPSREEREKYNPELSGNYGDMSAVHFATERILDATYGSETGNEIFFTFPSAHIASQYYFRGDLAGDNTGNHNDQWIWANEHRGIDINTGLVFIPEEAMVNSDTGSRYELDENKNPIINENGVDLIKQISNWPQFNEFAQELIKTIDYTKPESRLEKIESSGTLLSKEFEINDDRLLKAILARNNLDKLLKSKNGTTNIDGVAKDILGDAGILYREAENPILSKDYWENYFQQHPEQKPTKIVYYKGGDPTAALYKWRKDNGIRKNTKDETIGFPERESHEYSPEATQGMDRFRSFASKIIEEMIEDNFKAK